MRGVLRLTAFRRLWLSLGLSSLGDWLGLLAATAMAASLGAQNSYAAANLAVSGVLILRLAPAVLLGPVAGAFADRFDRKATMVIGDLLRFVLFASIPLVGTLWWLFVATVLIEIVGLFWLPAKDATVPNLVPRERLEAANQLSLATTYGSAPVAAVLFTLLSLGTGIVDNVAPWIGGPADVAMYVNALTNLVAAIVILRLDMPRRPTASQPGQEAAARAPGMWRSIVDGWSFVAKTKLIRGLVLGMLGAFGAGGFVIGVAPTFATDLGAGAPAYGMLFAAVFTGLAVGMWVGPRLLPDFTRWRLFALSLVLAGVWLCCLAIFPNSVMAVLFTLLLGIASGVAWVTGYTLLGLEVADEVRGRTFAFVQNGARIVLIAVMAIAPGLAALLGERRVEVGEVSLQYNGAAVTLLIAGLLALVIGAVSYRVMSDQPEISLWDDLTHAWRSRPSAQVHPPVDHPGLFVAFEGGDGAGKSSQVRLLAAWLRADLHREVITTREPGATELGATIRQLLLHTDGPLDPHAEALLFAADRAQHVNTVIKPALERGVVVLTDRYVDSSIAYQGGGRGFDPAGIERISTWATSNLVPDLTVLLDLDPVVARRRLGATGVALDRLEEEGMAFHRRVREMFLTRARRWPRRYLVLDATADPLELNEQIRRRLAPLLGSDSAGATRSAPSAAAATEPTEAIHHPEPTPVTTDQTTAARQHDAQAAHLSPVTQPPVTQSPVTQPPAAQPTTVPVRAAQVASGQPTQPAASAGPTVPVSTDAASAPSEAPVSLDARPSLQRLPAGRPTPPRHSVPADGEPDPWDPR